MNTVIVSYVSYVMVYVSHTWCDTQPNRCPQSDSIYPCRCNESDLGFVCGNTITNGVMLKYIFDDLSRHSSNANIYERLTFKNSIVEKLESDTFSKFVFRHISVVRNDYLSLIDLNAFSRNYLITSVIDFESNPSLVSATQQFNETDLFAILSKFVNCSEINVIDCGLRYVPENAFRVIIAPQTRLERLSLANNKIAVIANHAFHNLVNLKYLNLNQNSINVIEKLAFSFKQTSNSNLIVIDLSKNHLNSSSFQFDAFSSLDRSVNIDLSFNSITFINNTLFMPLLRRYSNIKLWNNNISCGDCRLKWLSVELKCDYREQNLFIYSRLIEFECKLLKEDFVHCSHSINDSNSNLGLICPLTNNSISNTQNYLFYIFIILLVNFT